MRPGITIQHAREVARDSDAVRGDVMGLIGVIPQGRWPRGMSHGDHLELRLTSHAELLGEPARVLVDPVTRRAVRSFFENGGRLCFLFGVCIESEQDLMVDDPFDGVLNGLLYRLRGDEEIALLSMPVLAYLGVDRTRQVPISAGDGVIARLVAHCAEMNNRFLIVDPPRDLHERGLLAWAEALRDRCGVHACYGAIYYPWLKCGEEIFPPGGAVGGLYARVEAAHEPFGVGWPPANELLRGVTHPEVELRWSETGELSAAGINPILTQPARGVVVWGARTMSRDEKWLHINARRTVSVVAEQLRRDSAWVVFENQRPDLWKMVERLVKSRLEQVWEAGLLTGDRAGSDYAVQCDSELNPPAVRDAGEIHVRVVFRPISTTEHIVLEMRLGSGEVETGGL